MILYKNFKTYWLITSNTLLEASIKQFCRVYEFILLKRANEK